MKGLIAGIDWGREEDQLFVMDAQGAELLRKRFTTDPEGVSDLCDFLLGMSDAGSLKVAIEDASRPIALALLHRGVRVFVVTPKKLDAFRKVYKTAPVKDDVLDARLLADLLRTLPDVARRVRLPNADMEVLKRWSRRRSSLVEDRVAATHALCALLDDFYPQLLSLPWKLNERVMLDLLTLIPDPRLASEVEMADVERVLGRCRLLSAAQVLTTLRSSSRVLDEKVVDACVEIAAQQLEILRQLDAHERFVDAKIAALLEKQVSAEELSDAAILMSLPGVGVTVSATILGEAATELATLDQSALRLKTVAPVTSQTGKQHPARAAKPHVRRRYSVHARLAVAMYHMANEAKKHSTHYANMYARMKSRGHSHGRACRQLADRMLDVLFAMLRDRSLYDPQLHGATRR